MQIFSLLIFAFLFLVSLNKTARQNSLFAVLQYSEIFGLQMVRKYSISFSSTTKFRLKLMFCVIFVNVLVWRRFGVPLFPIYAPLVPICVTLSTHPISRYFCKDSLMTPPNTPPHFKPLYCYCYPSKNFHRTISFIFHSCPFVFHSCSLVFTRVHSCSIRVHSCSFVFHSCSLVFHSCSTRVPLVFIHVPLVFTRVHSCSFVFIRVHSCSDLCGVLDMMLLFRPFPAQIILLWKGPLKLCIECHLVPQWAFPPKSPG